MSEYWKIKGFDPTVYSVDSVSLAYEFDVQGYISDLLNALRQHEDAVGERVVIEWLESRGWRVERMAG